MSTNVADAMIVYMDLMDSSESGDDRDGCVELFEAVAAEALARAEQLKRKKKK